MGDITGRNVDDTFKDFLRFENNGQGADATLRDVEDGKGNILPIKVSTTGTSFSGALVFDTSLDLNGNKFTNVDTTSTFEDVNTKTILGFSPQAGADNYIVVDNRATASGGPQIAAAGTNLNINLNLKGKGSGRTVITNATFSGETSAGTNKITDLVSGTNANDAVNYGYVNSTFQPLDADLTSIAATTATGVLKRTSGNTWATGATLNDLAVPTTWVNFNSQILSYVATPVNGPDAANKTYVDGQTAGLAKTDGTRAFTAQVTMNGPLSVATLNGASLWITGPTTVNSTLSVAGYAQFNSNAHALGNLSAGYSVFANNGHCYANTNGWAHSWFIVRSQGVDRLLLGYTIDDNQQKIIPLNGAGQGHHNSMITFRGDNNGINIGASGFQLASDGNLWMPWAGKWLSNIFTEHWTAIHDRKVYGDGINWIGMDNANPSYCYMRRTDGHYQRLISSYNTVNFINDVPGGGYIHVDTNSGGHGVTYWGSDERKKDNIEPCTIDASEKIKAIPFVQFDWKPESGHTGHRDCGVTAQTLQEIDPEFVIDVADSLQVNEPVFLANVAKALQEALLVIDDLKEEVATLKTQVAELQANQNK